MFRVSFTQQNVQMDDGRSIFARRHRDRFEWIALLAYCRATQALDGGWVSRDEIARLPKWSDKTRKHIGDNVGRYLKDLTGGGFDLVDAKSQWTGPYRLRVLPSDISFDLPREQVTEALHIQSVRPEIQRDDLIRFVPRYVRAEMLLQGGKLIGSSYAGTIQSAHGMLTDLAKDYPAKCLHSISGIGVSDTQSFRGTAEMLLQGGKLIGSSYAGTIQSAHGMLTDLAKDYPANSRLQLIAILAAVRVQFRLGRFRAARETLLQYEGLINQVGDSVLESQYYLSLAWSYRRAESGTRSNRTVEAMHSKARESALWGGDRSCLGLLAYREAWSLARKKQYEDALARMSFAVESAIITSNLATLQAFCADLGSIMHRIGPRYYWEARRWILTGILLARWARIGLDDAHGEMILGKMYSEMRNRRITAALWLTKAGRIAAAAGNAVNHADVRMVWAFWHRQYGDHKDIIETLGKALVEFRHLREFDSRQKERYIMREFPSVWLKVLAFAKAHASDEF